MNSRQLQFAAHTHTTQRAACPDPKGLPVRGGTVQLDFARIRTHSHTHTFQFGKGWDTPSSLSFCLVDFCSSEKGLEKRERTVTCNKKCDRGFSQKLRETPLSGKNATTVQNLHGDVANSEILRILFAFFHVLRYIT